MGLFGGTKRTTKTTNQDNRQVFEDYSDRSVRNEFEDNSDQSRRAEDGSVIAGDGATINQTGLALDAFNSGLGFAEDVVERGFGVVDRQAARSTDLASQVSGDAFDFVGEAYQDSLEISSSSLNQAFANTQAGLVKQQGDFMKFAGVIAVGAIAVIGLVKMRAA